MNFKRYIHIASVACLVSATITGDYSKQDLWYTQKPTYLVFLTNNIWSYLLWSPVILLILLSA